MHTAYIGFGANRGKRREQILRAWQNLGRLPEIRLGALSSPYESAPVGIDTQYMFINAVGYLQTDLAPEQLLSALLNTEKALGRDRNKGCDRTIDLDLLTYDRLILRGTDLTIPHPGIVRRLFVLVPLAEIAPDFTYPVNGKNIRQLIDNLASSDQQIIRLIWPICAEEET